MFAIRALQLTEKVELYESNDINENNNKLSFKKFLIFLKQAFGLLIGYYILFKIFGFDVINYIKLAINELK